MKEKISVYVFVLKNVFGNIKFVRVKKTEQGIVKKKITTEMSNHLFLFSSRILIAIKVVYLQVIGKCVYERMIYKSCSNLMLLSAISCENLL